MKRVKGGVMKMKENEKEMKERVNKVKCVCAKPAKQGERDLFFSFF